MENEKYIIMYSTPEGDVRVQAIIKDETIWLTQKGIASLFDVGVPAVSKHLKHIFEEGELIENAVVSKMEITAGDGKNYGTSFYNLDAINHYERNATDARRIFRSGQPCRSIRKG